MSALQPQDLTLNETTERLKGRVRPEGDIAAADRGRPEFGRKRPFTPHGTYNRRRESPAKIFQAVPSFTWGWVQLLGGKGARSLPPCIARRRHVRQGPGQISPSQRSAAIRARLKDAPSAARCVP